MKRSLLILSVLFLIGACEKENDENAFIRFYGDAREDIGYSVAIADDGYLICGKFDVITRDPVHGIVADTSKLGIIKTDFNGNTIWKKSFPAGFRAVGTKVLVLSDSSVICTGHVIDPDVNEADVYVVKLNGDGSAATGKIFVSAGNQTGTDILRTTEGFLIMGTTDVERLPIGETTGNTAGKKDILLLRLNSSLNLIVPATPIGYPGNDYGAAIKHNPEGGYIIVGTTDRSDPGQAGNNIFLVKVNIDGSATEPAILGGTDDEYAADIEVLENGYLITGTVGASGARQSVYISGIPSDIYSGPLFTKKIEKTESWSVSAMSRYKSNYFVLAGKSGSLTQSKILIIVIDREGNQVEGKEVITGSTGVQAAYDVAADDKGYVIAVGKNSYESNSMISLVKLIP